MTVHVGSLHCQLMTRSMHAQLVYLIKWFRIDQGYDTWQSSSGIKALKLTAGIMMRYKLRRRIFVNNCNIFHECEGDVLVFIMDKSDMFWSS